jgi:hypothetical protein
LPHPDAKPPFVDLMRTNAILERLSTNNLAFQTWGKEFMLRVANKHLSSVPLFGLKGPLRAEEVTIQTYLEATGVRIDLSTLDGQYAILYARGVIDKAVAWKAEMTGLFRDPSKLEHFRDNVGPWSKAEARSAAEALLKSKGLDIRQLGGRPTPLVRADTFNLLMPDGLVKPVTVFYTVHWVDRDVADLDVVEIRFRRTATGEWAVTEWFRVPAGPSEAEPTDFASTYERFFAPK